MKSRILAALLCLFAVGVAWQSVSGQHLLKHHHRTPPACEPGFKIVEEVVYQDVPKVVCKMVPETKKKWVYDWIDDPFCILDGKHGHCPQCCGPHCRKQLVKRLIDEPCPTLKCVTETVMERVAVTVYKKVPCGEPEMLPVAPNKVVPDKVLPGKIMPPAVKNGKPEPAPAQPVSRTK